MKEFLLNNYSTLTRLFELSAFVFGAIYYKKSRDIKLRFFINFLGITLFVETIGYYPKLLINNYDNEIYIALKNSVFCKNYWLYNSFLIANITLLTFYFKSIISARINRKILNYGLTIFLLFSLSYLIITQSFFVKTSSYNFIIGSLLVFMAVTLFYYEFINSDRILNFNKNIHFYLSLVLLLWHICITPLFIYGTFYNIENPDFVVVRRLILLSSNILMYLCFTIFFIMFLHKRTTS